MGYISDRQKPFFQWEVFVEVGSQAEVLMPLAHALALRGGLRVLPRRIEENHWRDDKP